MLSNLWSILSKVDAILKRQIIKRIKIRQITPKTTWVDHFDEPRMLGVWKASLSLFLTVWSSDFTDFELTDLGDDFEADLSIFLKWSSKTSAPLLTPAHVSDSIFPCKIKCNSTRKLVNQARTFNKEYLINSTFATITKWHLFSPVDVILKKIIHNWLNR